MEQVIKKKRSFFERPVLFAIVVAVGVALICIFLSSFIANLVVPEEGMEDYRSYINTFAYRIVRIVVAFLIILIMRLVSRRKYQFGFRKENLGISLALASIGLISAAYNIINPLFYDGVLVPGTELLPIILGGIAPGFYEEVLFRGLIFQNMMNQWADRKNYILKSVLISGLAFGLIHLLNLRHGLFLLDSTLIQVVNTTGVGVFFCAVYARTRNLWGPVIIHTLTDISADLIYSEADLGIRETVIMLVFGVVYLLIGLYLIRSKKQGEITKLWKRVPKTV
ncbi:CPBP family intramembrane glutamic endopeptidase [Christensenella tenuis]|jgi:uncharacterized protein|uniref:CPBP family intramembrane metalloprotease n=1 Tax=Christensenella tenuis TaxID=2763033 RepID=A0ABR7EDU1_9FIRM|nr:type II CAAX endopeptidase family protein [Christensenella tenuis]MBC5647952.1 CPBP family intramembrane metalloprotease [Christensenella tenuis]